jgi:sugar lactone lactonase YvrE
MKKVSLLLLPIALFLGTAANAQLGYINTVAGDGIAGFAGDGTSATTAKFDTIQFIAVDDSENIYVADAQNNRIRKIYKSNGLITTIAGTGAAGYAGDYGLAVNAEINYPVAIALDANANVIFTDGGNGVVREITKTTGVIHTIAGTGIFGPWGNDSAATACRFEAPTGIAVDASGNIYVADADPSNSVVRVIDAANGNIYAFAGTTGVHGFGGDGAAATAATLNQPLGISLDNMGNLYIADWENAVVRKVNISSGIISTVAGIHGNFTAVLTNGPATSVPISYPTDVACDSHGNVYITDVGTGVIRELTVSNGNENMVAGDGAAGFAGDGGPALGAELDYPFAIALDPSNNFYIGDLLNFRVRKVNAYSLSIPEISTSGSFEIYPNPVSSMLNIAFSSDYNTANSTLEIMDVTGRTIVNSPLSIVNSQSCVDVSSLPTGMYFIKVSNAKDSQVVKFIKE